MSNETVTLIGIGVALLSTLVLLFRWLRQDIRTIRQDVRHDLAVLRQDIKETNSRIDAMASALNNRIDNLYQALFSHKDPAA